MKADRNPSQSLFIGLVMSILLTIASAGVVGAAGTAALPDYRKPVLLPSSQTNAWTNVVPNALADYFTYIPYTTADAVKLGFPSSCGRLPGDAASTEDCYTITAKKFQQQLALPGIFGGGNGLIDPATGFPFAPANYPWVYGYGSGGAGWLLPYYDTTKAGVVANTPVTGNAPAPFTDGTFSSTGIWHFPAPTIKGTQGRPVRVQWLNELPNEKPTGFDPTVCDGAPFDCFPYNRIVTHVHGAHVGPESDGMVHSWFTPGFTDKGPLWESTRQYGPEGTYYYPMDQEASTIWYHDHSTGLTHNNTNMGLAGFFPITDANEKRLQGIGGPKYLPTGAQELGFALQDRIFYNDGQLAMPDAPIIDAAYTTCAYTIDPVSGDITPTVPANCAPLFMKDPIDGHLIPYVNNGTNVPLLATSATLEFFGNMPVVNGVTYGKYNVDKGVYRMRFLGGTDSRAWALRLKVAASNPARYLPFWVIGTEQGLLNNPAKSESLLIMPGERYDVLVDFNSAETLLSDGTTSAGPMDLANQRVIVENWAGDGPYGGEVILPPNDPLAAAFRSVDIPEVMVFDVSATALGAADVPAPTTALALRPANIQPLVADAPTRTVSLVEIVDNFGRIMPTIDARGFMEFPVTELPQLGNTEQWDIVNTTVDAHPMHLHQVAFQLINREDINVLGLDPVTGDPILDVVPAQIVPPYNPASYTVTQPAGSTLVPAGIHEAGWKDTVMCPPGKVTRVIAKYDIPGIYVWHCHILSHEEHDMMRPLVVTTPATSVTLDASGVSQPSNATMTPVTLTAQAFTGIAAYPVGSGFEYEFVVTQGATVIPEQPTRIASKILSSTVDGFNMTRSASWTPPSTPGTYTITVSAKAMGPAGPGNPLQTASVNYTVANATQTITFTPPTTATFGDAPIILSATGGASGNPVTFAVTSGPGNITGGNTLNITGVGTIVVTASQAGNATYSAAADVPVSIVVSPRAITIAANNASRTYGAANPPNPGYSIISGTLATGDSIASVSYTYQNSATATAFAGTTHSITPGSVVFSTGSAANYAITYVNGLLRINRAPLTITINNQTKTYGTAFTFNGSEFTTIGLLNTDQVSYVAMTSNGAPGYATVSGSPYPIVPSTSFGTGLGNYNINYVNGAMTVTKATPVITWGTPAPITFGTPLSGTQLNATANVGGTFTYSPTAGTVLNTSSAVLSVTFTPTSTANYTTAAASVIQLTVAGASSVARIGTAPPYPSIQAAYNAAVNNDVIEVIGTNVPGNFTANKASTTVTIKGGYSSSFTPVPANTTTIQGTVTLQQGTVIMDGIVVQ
ncbi:MAG: multicopper oxidase domain-containing protein [Geobacteraceae bacterium]|nr:multicopper oxidase domain-containing protein [Geobacteraceae bacterium]